MSGQRTRSYGIGFSFESALDSTSPTFDQLMSSARQSSNFIDRSRMATRILCCPSIYKAIKAAYSVDDPVFSPVDRFRSLKIIEDYDIWPRCFVIEYADGSSELCTPFGSIHKPPPIQTQPQPTTEPTTATQPTNYPCPTETNNE